MVEITVQSKTVLFDKEDLSVLVGLVPAGADWLLDRDGYLCISFRCPVWRRQLNICVHRWIMNGPEGLIVDHVNRDRLDNRRSNLRLVTVAQNTQNSGPKKTKGRTSSFKGVCLDKQSGKWQAQIKVKGISKYLGQFYDEADAAKAYDVAAKQVYGEFAYQNF
jgi:hypothetical protein